MFEILLDSYSIIGEESQTIHMILHKNDKININKNYLISASSEELIENLYKNVDYIIIPGSKRELNKDLERVNHPAIVNLKNLNGNNEYISLSNGGKIMKIIPSLYNNLYIRLDSLLAFNNGIELYTDKKIDIEINKLFPNNFFGFNRRLLNRRQIWNRNYPFINNFEIKRQFCLIKTKLNNEIEENNFNNLANSFLYDKNNSVNDMIFISGKKNLFEKRLGEGEAMVLLARSLIAFEGSISFRTIKSKNMNFKYVNELNDIIIDGPGLIIFEQCERFIPLNKTNKFIIIMVTIIVIFLHVFINFIVLRNF